MPACLLNGGDAIGGSRWQAGASGMRVSQPEPLPFSHSRAQEPGCHVLLLLVPSWKSQDWRVLVTLRMERELSSWKVETHVLWR
jgi:hypothetical protein